MQPAEGSSPVYEIRPAHLLQEPRFPRAGIYEASGEWLWHRPGGTGLEVCLIGGGTGEFQFQDQRYLAKEGDLLLIRPATKVSIKKTSRENLVLRFFHVRFDSRAIRLFRPDWKSAARQLAVLGRQAAETSPSAFLLPEHFPLQPAAERIGAHQRMVMLTRGTLPAARLELTAMILEFLTGISRLFREQIHTLSTAPDTPETRLNRQVQRAVEYIETHLADPLSAHDLAEALALNKNYLGRIFRSATGATIGNFILQRKMELAKARMLGGARLIKEVAADLGFSDAHYFARLFKRHVGVRPSDFATYGDPASSARLLPGRPLKKAAKGMRRKTDRP